MEITSPCVYINKKQGEKLRKFLVEYFLFDKSKLIKLEGDFIFLPILREMSEPEKALILENFNSALFSVSNFKFRKNITSEKFFDILKKYFDPNELEFIPRSLDIIGKIAILEIPSEIQLKENLLAELLLEYNKALESVFIKVGKVNGEFRTRELKFLAGTNNTSTIHKENGCIFELDIKKVYFSPRLGTEHARIADMINPNEIVLDMFAGIGPFSILIARKKNAKVYAIDKNPDAFFYLKKNILLNKVENLVTPLLGDAQEIISKHFKNKFDRIIMNLPEKAFNFLPAACEALKTKGGLIHFYMFLAESEPYKKVEDLLGDKIRDLGRNILNLKIKKVKSTAPHEWQICVDIQVG